jgi:hypothetical protein
MTIFALRLLRWTAPVGMLVGAAQIGVLIGRLH